MRLAMAALICMLLAVPLSYAQTGSESLPGGAVLPFCLLLGVIALWLVWKLRQSEHSRRGLHAALDSAGTPMLMLDEERRIVFMNQAFHALGGLPEQPRGLNEFPREWRSWLETALHDALEAGVAPTREHLLAPSTHHAGALLRLGAVRLGSEEERHGVLLWCENLAASNDTVRTALEREHTLRTRTQRFIQTLIDVIPRPVFVKDEHGRFVLANEAFCASHDLPRQSLIGHTAQEVGLARFATQAVALEDARVMAGAPIFREEYSTGPQPGEERYTVVSKQTCIDSEGQRVLVGTHIDVTPWRLAERELQVALTREAGRHARTQAFIQRLLDVIPEPVYVKDEKARYIMVNDAFTKHRQVSREAVVGHTARELQPDPAIAEMVLAEDAQVLAGAVVNKVDATQHPVTRAKRWRIVTKGSCLDAEGQRVIIGANFDITAMHEAEERLQAALAAETDLRRRTEAFIQRLIDAIPLPIGVRDEASRHLYANAKFVEETGQAREAVIGQRMLDFCPDPEQGERSRNEDLAVLKGLDLYEERQDPGLGSKGLRDLIVSKRCCLDVDDRPAIVVAHVDITALREAERETHRLMHAGQSMRERTLEYMQRMADMIPHPFFVKDAQCRYLVANEAFLGELGLQAEQLIGHTAQEFTPDPQRARAIAEEDAAVLAGHPVYEQRCERTFTGLGPARVRVIAKRSCLDAEGQPVIAAIYLTLPEHTEPAQGTAEPHPA